MLTGVAHVHTTVSFDGKLSPQEAHSFFVERHLQFVLLSEHIETLDAGSINALIETCANVSDERCVLIPGVEFHDWNLLVFGIAPVEPYRSPDDLVKALSDQGAFFAYAHPVRRPELLERFFSRLDAFEVWNSKYDGKLCPRQNNVAWFHRLLKRRDLRPLAGLDFHKPSDFTNLVLKVECDAAEEALSAIRAGDYTLCSNGNLVDLYPHPRSVTAWASGAARSLYSAVYDTGNTQYRWLVKRGIPFPKPLKTALKKLF